MTEYQEIPRKIHIETDDEILDDIGAEEEIVTTVEELLINCVMVRPPLWDSRLSIKETSKTIRDQLWLETYEEFGRNTEFSVEYLIKKWRNLRDTYVRLKGEYTPSGSAAKKKKKWNFFDMMIFLNDSISYRPTVSNLKSPTGSCSSTVTSPLVSPAMAISKVSDDEDTPLRTSRSRQKPQNMEAAIIETLNKINAPPIAEPIAPITPICMRISEMISKMPQNERTLLEIKLLQVAYEGAKNFL